MNPIITNLLDYCEKLKKSTLLFIACFFIFLLGIIDYLTGPELAFSIFYLLPIMLVAWLVNLRTAVYLSLASSIVWFFADVLSRESYIHPLFPYWNALVRFSFFLIVTYILSSLKQSMDREAERARTDYLTGVANLRYFSELADIELGRARRYNHPLTLAYLDIDDFKVVNDRLGHAAGDLLIKKFAETLKNNIRLTDIIARVGGDEFVILFPETGPDTAYLAIERVKNGVLTTASKNQWPITFSLGVLTCLRIPDSIHTLLTRADRLMYSAKSMGKNGFKYEVLQDG